MQYHTFKGDDEGAQTYKGSCCEGAETSTSSAKNTKITLIFVDITVKRDNL